MDFIVNEVMQLEVVHISDCNRVVEVFASSAVLKPCLAVLTEPCLLERLENVRFVSAVKYRRHNMPAKSLSGISEVNLKHLSDVHTRRNAERVKNNVKRSTVRQERHILNRKNS